MPYVRSRLYRRDDTDSSSTALGQRVSVDGGIDSKRNIIAMILATVLFIVVVVSYQYFSIAMTRREEERRRTGNRHKRRRSQPNVSLASQFRALVRRWMSFLKLVVSGPAKSSPSISSTGSTEVLLKKITPRRPPKRRTSFNLLCPTRRKEQPKPKRVTRRELRPLLLNSNSEVGHTYLPRSPMDEKTQDLLRSPDAFAEFSDPMRNMSFVRTQDEVQRRRERDEIWYEVPLNAPEKPVVACVAPLAIRKKSSLLREGDNTDNEQAQPTSTRVIYPPRPLVVPTTPPSTVHDDQSLSFYSPYSPRQLSIIQEEPESPAQRSFFEIDDDDDDEVKPRRKRIRLRFPLPSATKASLQEDIDVFSIGSFSASEESSDDSGR